MNIFEYIKSKVLKQRNEEEEYEKALYEYFAKERERYYNVLMHQTEQYDKHVFIISGVLFNVVIIFMDKIVPFKVSFFPYLLILSIVLLAFSMIFTLVSFFVSAYESRRSIEAVDYSQKNEEDLLQVYERFKVLNGNLVPSLNFLSLFSVVVSILMLTFYISTNLFMADEIIKAEKISNSVNVIDCVFKSH